MMNTRYGVQAVVGLTGFERQVGGTRLFAEQFMRLELPSTISLKEIEVMAKDFESINAISKKNPAAMVKLLNAACKYDFGTARKLANEIGLNEENMARSGGGQVGWAVGIAVGFIVYAVVLSALSGAGESGEPSVEPEGTDGGLPPGGVP